MLIRTAEKAMCSFERESSFPSLVAFSSLGSGRVRKVFAEYFVGIYDECVRLGELHPSNDEAVSGLHLVVRHTCKAAEVFNSPCMHGCACGNTPSSQHRRLCVRPGRTHHSASLDHLQLHIPGYPHQQRNRRCLPPHLQIETCLGQESHRQVLASLQVTCRRKTVPAMHCRCCQ